MQNWRRDHHGYYPETMVGMAQIHLQNGLKFSGSPGHHRAKETTEDSYSDSKILSGLQLLLPLFQIISGFRFTLTSISNIWKDCIYSYHYSQCLAGLQIQYSKFLAYLHLFISSFQNLNSYSFSKFCNYKSGIFSCQGWSMQYRLIL